MNIDWSKAPKDATHYLPDSPCDHECWVKPGFSWRLKDQNGWHPDTTVDGDIAHGIAIQRPKTWTGTGLPPVGTVCEYRVNDGPWYKCEVRYVVECPEGGAVVIYCDHLEYEQYLSAFYGSFRPIRTKEQIEAEERESKVQAMLEITTALHISNMREAMEELYREGYRKQPKEGA